MVDSVKQYNLTGVASQVELGKTGSKIDGASSASQVSLKKNDGSLAQASVADGTLANNAVTLAQLESIQDNKFQYATYTVNYNDGNVALDTFSANATVFSVTIEKGAGNWVGADSNTNITVGTSSNNSLLFSTFDPTVQSVDETNHTFSAQSQVNAYVTQGGASSGTATILIQYSGQTV